MSSGQPAGGVGIAVGIALPIRRLRNEVTSWTSLASNVASALSVCAAGLPILGMDELVASLAPFLSEPPQANVSVEANVTATRGRRRWGPTRLILKRSRIGLLKLCPSPIARSGNEGFLDSVGKPTYWRHLQGASSAQRPLPIHRMTMSALQGPDTGEGVVVAVGVPSVKIGPVAMGEPVG